jgi:Mn2+/Fe2+ NRAMP family transporter
MGEHANLRRTNWLAYAAVAVVLGMNALLLYNTFGGSF